LTIAYQPPIIRSSFGDKKGNFITILCSL